ncbi:unnamed protein product [Urochloa humidicola]
MAQPPDGYPMEEVTTTVDVLSEIHDRLAYNPVNREAFSVLHPLHGLRPRRDHRRPPRPCPRRTASPGPPPPRRPVPRSGRPCTPSRAVPGTRGEGDGAGGLRPVPRGAAQRRRRTAHGGRRKSAPVEELFPRPESRAHLAKMYGGRWGNMRERLEHGGSRTELALEAIVDRLRTKYAAAVDEARRRQDPARVAQRLADLVLDRVREERERQGA